MSNKITIDSIKVDLDGLYRCRDINKYFKFIEPIEHLSYQESFITNRNWTFRIYKDNDGIYKYFDTQANIALCSVTKDNYADFSKIFDITKVREIPSKEVPLFDVSKVYSVKSGPGPKIHYFVYHTAKHDPNAELDYFRSVRDATIAKLNLVQSKIKELESKLN